MRLFYERDVKKNSSPDLAEFHSLVSQPRPRLLIVLSLSAPI